jgi:hypothetical protein
MPSFACKEGRESDVVVTFRARVVVFPWLWKKVKIRVEIEDLGRKAKYEMRGRHID